MPISGCRRRTCGVGSVIGLEFCDEFDSDSRARVAQNPDEFAVQVQGGLVCQNHDGSVADVSALACDQVFRMIECKPAISPSTNRLNTVSCLYPECNARLVVLHQFRELS